MHSIGNAVKAILESGESPVALFSNNDSTEAVCEEALRFDPPLHFFDRYALEDVEVEGVRLKKGEKIGLLLAAANRDPSRWKNPDRFDPGRLAALCDYRNRSRDRGHVREEPLESRLWDAYRFRRSGRPHDRLDRRPAGIHRP